MKSLHRRICVAVAVGAALVSISVANASFSRTAAGGPQTVASATLSPPTAPAASCNNGTATITWTATPSMFATGYEILRGTVSGGPYAHLANITGRTTTTYGDSALVQGTTYYYVVRATRLAWVSTSTSQVTADTSNC
jgi:hypothetical protein